MRKEKKVYLLPIAIMLGYIPLIVHSHVYDTKFGQFAWFPDSSAIQIDFFLYFKMIGIIILGILIAGVLLYSYIKREKLEWSGKWYFILMYGMLVLMSGLFSEYRYWAFHGTYEMFEPVPVVIAYLLVCYYAYTGVQTEKEVKYILSIAGIGILILMLIGVFQFFGLDIFRTSFGKRLILDIDMWDQLDTIGFTFPLKTSYSTLYNTNFFSFYFGCIIPVLVLLFIYEKQIKKKILLLVMSVMSLINMIGSNSKTGIVVLFIVSILGVILYLPQLKKHFAIILAVLAALGILGIMLGMYTVRSGGISNLVQQFTHNVDYDKSEKAVKKIETNDENVVFDMGDHEVRVSYYILDDNIYIFMKDENGNDYPYSYAGEDEMTWKLEAEDLPEFLVTPVYIEDKIGITVETDGYEWNFSNQFDDTYYYYNGCGKFDKIEDIKVASVFDDNIFSGRGKIWNKLLPRLKHCILLGNGANNFVFNYPQNDYIGKKIDGQETLFDVKPHNMYLQQFSDNGLLALLAFLVFYILYLIESFRLYLKSDKDSWLQTLGIGIFLGTVAYMIAGMANDSNVNTAPVFWTLLGIGLAVNRMNKNNFVKEKSHEKR